MTVDSSSARALALASLSRSASSARLRSVTSMTMPVWRTGVRSPLLLVEDGLSTIIDASAFRLCRRGTHETRR